MVIHVFFFLFEGIGKNFPFNSILNFAILSDFKIGLQLFVRLGGGVLGWFLAS